MGDPLTKVLLTVA